MQQPGRESVPMGDARVAAGGFTCWPQCWPLICSSVTKPGIWVLGQLMKVSDILLAMKD